MTPRDGEGLIEVRALRREYVMGGETVHALRDGAVASDERREPAGAGS